MFRIRQYFQNEHLYRRDCHKCGFLWLSTCCNDVYIGIGERRIVLSGCIKNQHSDVNSLYVYGGSFTSQKVNPVTSSQSCTTGLTQTAGPNNIKVCLAERLVSNLRNLPLFGGMFSCDNVNPALASARNECPTNYNMYSMGIVF
ncbi:unnamed protein product [Rotaria sp. Silwood2]|nr:unnamed protein product [Rotaria sp. Silwood2]CAF4073029.1 unnamed protein product [Rotaria sp. Silwood2]